jgi:RNA polymerase sigma-70 factor (ECF subfamily)
MRAIAWKILGDADLVDEATQDAYLKAHRSIGRFRGESEFGTWLHRIVVNASVDQIRRRSTRHEVSIDLEPELSVPPADDRISDSEHIRQAMLLLPVDQRIAVLLVDCEGYSYDEAADVLGISAGAIGSRLFRARTKLQAIGELI